MTAPKATYRPRRGGMAGQIPKYIAQWFAGERGFSFTAATPPHYYRLREYWQSWQARHPAAVPPSGFERMASRGETIGRLARPGSSAGPEK
jgi:hypothetical protein